jgi:hypothetical protein
LAQVQYDNFDLKILPEGTGYRAFVESPAGEGNGSFAVPFSPEELEHLAPYGSRNNREIGLSERLEYREQNYQAFGKRLFQTVFSDKVKSLFDKSLTKVKSENKGLRILLKLDDVPELARWPWEYLCDPDDTFLQFSSQPPIVIVRYAEVNKEAEPLAVSPPLKILVVIGKAHDLDVEGEWTKLKEALSSLETRGQVQLERLEKATLGNLLRKSRNFKPHVLHYIGHGTFKDERSLVLEKEDGSSDLVGGQELIVQLGISPLRLIILNACQGAEASETDSYVGIAQQLLKSGIPAVIAMQYAIGDAAAKMFASEFYTALADSYYPIDAALTEARRALFRSDPMEWGTPVLFMRSSNGYIIHPPLSDPPTLIKRSTPKAVIAAIIAGTILIGDFVGAITNTFSFISRPIIKYFSPKAKAILSAETLENGLGILTIRFENLPEQQREVPRIRLTVSPENGLIDRTQQPTGTLLKVAYNVPIPATLFNSQPLVENFAPYIYLSPDEPAIYAEFCFALVDQDMTKVFNKRGQLRVTPQLFDVAGNELDITVEPQEVIIELFNPGPVTPLYVTPENARLLGEQGCRT